MIGTPGAILTLGLGGSPSLITTLGYGIGDFVAPEPVVPRRHAGGFPIRKGYIIKGKRYWLTDDELMVLVAQEIASISRKDVKQVTAGKPKPISKKVWDLIAPMERLEALTPKEADEDDDEEVLMMFI
jgi:hypothetical protein